MTKRIVRQSARHEPVWWANDTKFDRPTWPMWVCAAIVGMALLGIMVTQ